MNRLAPWIIETGKQVLQLLQDASRKDHKTVLIITHNAAIAKMADRVVEINDAQSSQHSRRAGSRHR